jgi:hypothetical protein
LKYAGTGDDRVGDLLTEVVLCGLLQLLQDHRRDFRRRVLPAADLDPRVAVVGTRDLCTARAKTRSRPRRAGAHEALDREDRVLGVRDGLPLGHLANEAFSVLGDRHDRWRRPRAFLVDDDRGLAALHDRDDRVGRSEVDSNHFSWHESDTSPNLDFPNVAQ